MAVLGEGCLLLVGFYRVIHSAPWSSLHVILKHVPVLHPRNKLLWSRRSVSHFWALIGDIWIHAFRGAGASQDAATVGKKFFWITGLSFSPSFILFTIPDPRKTHTHEFVFIFRHYHMVLEPSGLFLKLYVPKNIPWHTVEWKRVLRC